MTCAIGKWCECRHDSNTCPYHFKCITKWFYGVVTHPARWIGWNQHISYPGSACMAFALMPRVAVSCCADPSEPILFTVCYFIINKREIASLDLNTVEIDVQSLLPALFGATFLPALSNVDSIAAHSLFSPQKTGCKKSLHTANWHCAIIIYEELVMKWIY